MHRILVSALFVCALFTTYLLSRDQIFVLVESEQSENPLQHRKNVSKDIWSDQKYIHIEIPVSTVTRTSKKTFIENCSLFEAEIQDHTSPYMQSIKGSCGIFDYEKMSLSGKNGLLLQHKEKETAIFQAKLEDFFLSWGKNQPIIEGSFCKILTKDPA